MNQELKPPCLSIPRNPRQLACRQRRDALATSLITDIQQRATINDVNNAIENALAQTSNNSNGVSTMGQSADGSYQQFQMLFDKMDELIHALRR